jgi:hypothetical protein
MVDGKSELASSEYLELFFNSHQLVILASAQSENMGDLIFDRDQATRATELSSRILKRLEDNPTARNLNPLILNMTAHMFGIMSERPLTCRYASADHADFVNAIFGVGSAFVRLRLGNVFQMDETIRRRFLLNFQGRASWREPLGQRLDPDLERDLSTVLFFFEAYIRSGFFVAYKG